LASQKTPEYESAQRAIDAFKKQAAEKGEQNVDKNIRSRFEAADRKLNGPNGALTQWNKRIKAAETSVDEARDRYTEGEKAPTKRSKNDPLGIL
jgi:hypothetical protein